MTPDEARTLAKQFREIDHTGDFVLSTDEIATVILTACSQQGEEDARVVARAVVHEWISPQCWGDTRHLPTGTETPHLDKCEQFTTAIAEALTAFAARGKP